MRILLVNVPHPAIGSRGGRPSTDQQAIRLLRQHNVLSMATFVAGFSDQTDRDLWRSFRQLVAYEPDQIQALHVTPHRWTPYYRLAQDRRIVETDTTRWDYKHQVLAMERVPPWRLILWLKLIELALQIRPKALARLFWNPDPRIRHAVRWLLSHGPEGLAARDRPVPLPAPAARGWPHRLRPARRIAGS